VGFNNPSRGAVLPVEYEYRYAVLVLRGRPVKQPVKGCRLFGIFHSRLMVNAMTETAIAIIEMYRLGPPGAGT
jgi:hypothetical protein